MATDAATDNIFPARSSFVNPDTGKYLPGYDAKHVSELLATLKDCAAEAGHPKKIHAADARAAKKELQSAALQTKLGNAVDRFNAGPKPRVKKDEAPADDRSQELQETAPEDLGQQYEDGEGNSPEVLRTVEIPDVKVGRWFYPARELHTEDGSFVQRNTSRDGKGEWVVA